VWFACTDRGVFLHQAFKRLPVAPIEKRRRRTPQAVSSKQFAAFLYELIHGLISRLDSTTRLTNHRSSNRHPDRRWKSRCSALAELPDESQSQTFKNRDLRVSRSMTSFAAVYRDTCLCSTTTCRFSLMTYTVFVSDQSNVEW